MVISGNLNSKLLERRTFGRILRLSRTREDVLPRAIFSSGAGMAGRKKGLYRACARDLLKA